MEPLTSWSFPPRTADPLPYAACTWTKKWVATFPSSHARTPARPRSPTPQSEPTKAWFEFHKVKYLCDGPIDAGKDLVFRRLDFPIAEPLAAYTGSRVRRPRLAPCLVPPPRDRASRAPLGHRTGSPRSPPELAGPQ